MRDNTYNNGFITYDDEATWLVTYADLVTILLVFFILLYALVSLETEKYKHAVETVKVQVKDSDALIGMMELMEIPESRDRMIAIEDITGLNRREKTLFESIQKFTKASGMKKSISTRIVDGKVVVTIQGKALFPSGSIDLSPESRIIFDQITQVLEDYPDFNINIKGHTDNVPISTDQFPSNWELSAVRATTVLKYLISKGISPKRLTATGYGDALPLVPNTSEENRSLNRRVEFVLEKKDTPR